MEKHHRKRTKREGPMRDWPIHTEEFLPTGRTRPRKNSMTIVKPAWDSRQLALVGNLHDVARAHMRTNRLSGAKRGKMWSSAPSWLYLMRLNLPGYGPVVKLGCSGDVESRMRFHLGMSSELVCKTLFKVPMATGSIARCEENQLHKMICANYPHAVIPSEIISKHLRLVSEVYDAALEQVIVMEMSRIAARLMFWG